MIVANSHWNSDLNQQRNFPEKIPSTECFPKAAKNPNEKEFFPEYLVQAGKIQVLKECRWIFYWFLGIIYVLNTISIYYASKKIIRGVTNYLLWLV